MSLLECINAGAAPWGKPLLQDISFSLDAGTIMVIVGPNGAGKTSLLHTLAGGMALAIGDIRLQQRPLAQWRNLERARAIAMLPQQSTLNFPFTVEQVILLGRSPHCSGAAVDQEILEQVLVATDSSALRQRLYTRLSGGERQRVQLARVMAQLWRAQDSSARLLLLDEPTTGLDLAHQQLIMRELRKLAAGGCAVVMVLHDFNLAAATANQVLVLQQGYQITVGSPHQVYTRDLFQQVFEVAVHIGSHPDSATPLVIQL